LTEKYSKVVVCIAFVHVKKNFKNNHNQNISKLVSELANFQSMSSERSMSSQSGQVGVN
jgi:hypothetical protein